MADESRTYLEAMRGRHGLRIGALARRFGAWFPDTAKLTTKGPRHDR